MSRPDTSHEPERGISFLTMLVLAALGWGNADARPAGADPGREPVSTWSIEDPWVREAPPGARVLAAYGTLHHRGKRPGALVKVDSEGFGRIETHAMVRDGSMMRMQAVPRLELPASGTVRLEPGEWHWMLYEATRRWSVGDQVPFVFHFSDGTRIERKLPVRQYPAP